MEDREQRTEEATPKRREKLRKEGKVAKSQDISAAAVIAAVTLAMAVAGPQIATHLLYFSARIFRLGDADRPLQALASSTTVLLPVAWPLFAAMLAAIAAGAAQARVFSFELVAFKPERLNPIPQLKKVLPSKDSLIELLKQLIKLLAIGAVVYSVISDATPRFAVLAANEAGVGAALVGQVAGQLALHGGVAFAVIAALDFFLAQRRFAEESKMSKQELKDERKEDEGDPLVRMRLRRRMMELGRSRGVADVSDATVMVLNPTHVSVALRYKPELDAAPTVISKGIDEVAMQMRAEARKHGIPMIESRKLARALYAEAKVGQPIPVAHYRAVAEIIARVMRLPGVRQAQALGGGA